MVDSFDILVSSEDAMGGWKKEGGGKPHEWHPSQKGVPSGVSALFFLYKNPRQSRPKAFLEGSKNFRESAFSGTFSSPHTFCTPPYHGPISCFGNTPICSDFLFSLQRNQGYGQGIRLGVLPGVPSQTLLERYFLWILVEKSTVIRPRGVDWRGSNNTQGALP